MKIYRNAVIILSILIALAVTIWLQWSNPLILASYSGAVNEESYQILKDYAYEVARNPNVKPKEGITITKSLTEDSLKVDVDASICSVQAIFQVHNHKEKIEGSIIKYEGNIDWKNVTYIEHTDVLEPWFYVFLSSIIFSALICTLYIVFYDVPIGIINDLARKKKDSLKKS